MTISTGAIISIIGVLVGIAGGIYGIYSNKKKNDDMTKNENKADGKETGMILTELGYIKSSVDDIKRKQDIADSRYIEQTCKMSAFDEWRENTERRITSLEDEFHNVNH